MSGPKSSYYTLTAEQRRILEQARREKLEKSRISSEIKSTIQKTKEFDVSFVDDIAISKMLQERGDVSFDKIEQKISQLQQITKRITNTDEDIESDDLKSLKSKLEKAKASYKQAEELYTSIVGIADENETRLEQSFADDISHATLDGFGALNGCEAFHVDLQNRINDVIRQSNMLTPSLIQRLKSAETQLESDFDISFLRNFEALTIIPLIAECETQIEDYSKIHVEFESLFAEYVLLCEAAHEQPKDLFCSSENYEWLKADVSRLEKKIAQAEEQAYIRSCIDEAMTEMGYSVVGHRDVKKKNGKHFTNELFDYGEGTVINVTYCDDGSITMELGGADTIDRAPDDLEADTLCTDMESFCEEFSEFEKLLLKKGVILKSRIKRLPPSADYAQIINVSDYELTENVRAFDAKKSARATKKKASLHEEQ